jgi:hypothetical protein
MLGGSVGGELGARCESFFARAKELLAIEKNKMETGSLHPFSCADPAIQHLRAELFGTDRKPAGEFKSLLNELDARLLSCLRAAIS